MQSLYCTQDRATLLPYEGSSLQLQCSNAHCHQQRVILSDGDLFCIKCWHLQSLMAVHVKGKTRLKHQPGRHSGHTDTQKH